MPILSTCALAALALAALDADFEHLRTCCSRCRFSAPVHLLLWMPIFSTCAPAALDECDELFTPCVQSHAPAPRSPCRESTPRSTSCLFCLSFARFAQKLPKTKSVITQTMHAVITQTMRLAPGVSSSNSWRPCSPRAVHTQSSKVLCHPHAVLRLHEVSSWSK